MRKNWGNFLVYIIIAIGLILRLVCIDKVDGLWNDEYVSWMISQKPLFNGFVHAVISQCHMPFYYLYLKFFTFIFGNSDLILRLSSVLAGIIGIWVMYLVGYEKDKKTGLICAGFATISPFLIYYSQEVRMYSILFVFSAASLLYTLKLVKNPNKYNITGYIISNFLILFTHTIGFIYIFFNLLYVSYKLFKNYKKEITILWSTIIISNIIFVPFVIKIITEKTFSQWWGHFSIAKILYLFTDYFSPILTNLTNSPDKFAYHLGIVFILFCILPSLIALILLIKALIKRENRELFYIAFLTLLVLIFAAISGKLVLLTKYSIEIYPILIYIVCEALSSLKTSWLKNITIIFLCLLNFVYLIISPISAPKIRRSEGHKILTDIFERSDIENGDYILLEYYPQDRFEKYFDFSKYNVISINKGNFPEYVSSNTSYADVYNNGRDIYKPIFTEDTNKYLDNKLNNEIIKKLQPGQSLVIATLDSVSMYSDKELQNITKNPIIYSKTGLPFLIFSHIKNQTLKYAMLKLPITYYESKGSWSVIKFTKLNFKAKH